MTLPMLHQLTWDVMLPTLLCWIKRVCVCQGHSSLDAPSELNPPQRIPSLFKTPLVPQAEG